MFLRREMRDCAGRACERDRSGNVFAHGGVCVSKAFAGDVELPTARRGWYQAKTLERIARSRAVGGDVSNVVGKNANV